MSHYIEELQAKKYLEQLMSVRAAEWQWFPAQHCFEVGDAAARPRLYFDTHEQFQTYVLSVYLEVDGVIAASNTVHFGRDLPADHDELFRHITGMDQAPLLFALLARLLRDRGSMSTTARPDHLKARIDNYLAVVRHKLLVDLPHNFQERMAMFKIERNASRVLPKPKRATTLHHR